MARKQYRWRGFGRWHSASGNAIVALLNPNGSGKRLILHAVEVYQMSQWASASAASRAPVHFVRNVTTSGGNPVPLCPHDSAATLPAGVSVVASCGWGGTPEIVTASVLSKTYSPSTLAYGTRAGTGINVTPRAGFFSGARPISQTEKLVLRPGESAALVRPPIASGVDQMTMPVQIAGRLIVHGSPNQTFSYTAVTVLRGGDAAIAIRNDSSSSIISVDRMEITELGSSDTPYLQLVPVGAVDPRSSSDALAQAQATPMDSAYGPLNPAHAQIVLDAPMLPAGVPQQYLSEGSTGSPKGLNYLHTKDFIGPQYAVLFPEYNSASLAVNSTPQDGLIARSNKATNILGLGASLTIRAGEGIALVSGAESATTAAGVQAAGWSAIEFGLVFSIDNASQPYLNISGIAPGSDVVVLVPGTDIVLTSVDSIGGTSFSWAYDQDEVPAVDVAIYKAGLAPLAFRNVPLGSVGADLIAAQAFDRNYSNP